MNETQRLAHEARAIYAQAEAFMKAVAAQTASVGDDGPMPAGKSD